MMRGVDSPLFFAETFLQQGILHLPPLGYLAPDG